MSYANAASHDIPVEQLSTDARATFITRTYLHLLGAIGMFTALEVLLFRSGLAGSLAQRMLGVSWLWILGGFVLVSWLARSAAHRSASTAVQYLALAGFVVAEAIIFVPLLWMANTYAPGVIGSAAVVTLFGFAALTAVAMITRKDFSFLRGILCWGGVIALVLIVAGAILVFNSALISPWPWWRWPGPRSFTTPRMFCITILKIVTSARRWSCSRPWR